MSISNIHLDLPRLPALLNQIINQQLVMLGRTHSSFMRLLPSPPLTCRPSFSLRYTRQYFEDLNTDVHAIQRQQQQAEAQAKKQQILSIKSNDKNPSNYIKKLRIGNPALDHFARHEQSRAVNRCEILTPEPIKPRVFVTAIRKYIITSIDKAVDAMAPVRKRYIMDAINELERSHKKVAKLMVPTFYNLIKHAQDQGKDPLRLFVHGCIIGKTQRFKNIRYHAKGKTGREKRDMCQVKVILYEKDENQFYEMIGSGRAPPAFASFVRYGLLEGDANHQKLMAFSGITTAKGRQQKREILKRRLSMRMKENQEKGTFVPKKTMEKQLIAEEGEKARQLIRTLKKEGDVPSIERRERLFKKNMDID